jgi:hypothetical protein
MVGRFRLKRATLCVLTATRLVEYVPEGAIVVIHVASPDTDQMVDVIWEGRRVLMFARDLDDQGEEVKTRAAAS